ncbi:HNH endonuclease [Serratia fonticola]|uniref:HNH endonuclease n=1 Tax=Serratia fonticola TaxID=47917 RepID=UPI00209804EB|nr:HNH endonuclease [Serratia fonticola]MCO7513062.1 HNH endonuclease [Serratia fonticola]
MASEDLWTAIQRGEIPASRFTEEQLGAIKAGKSKIPEYTCHHHQDFGRMQLILTDTHSLTGHIGGDKMSKGR